MNKWFELLKDNNYTGVKKYLRDGADISDVNEIGESVLAIAIRAKCDFDLLMLLVENNSDIFHIDDEGVSIFDIAITYDNIEMVEYLIEKGVDVNKTSRKSAFTALMAAVCYGRIEIVQILQKNGADEKAMDSRGLTASDFARKMNKKSILAVLDYDKNAVQNKNIAK